MCAFKYERRKIIIKRTVQDIVDCVCIKLETNQRYGAGISVTQFGVWSVGFCATQIRGLG